MILENKIYSDQIEKMIEGSRVDWEQLRGSSVLVTGAAGMLGSGIVDVLIFLNEKREYNTTIYALGRKKEKLLERFPGYADRAYFNIVCADVCDKLCIDDHIDYLIHAASNANPNMFANYPVDTLLGNVLGTQNLLKYGLEHDTKRMLYVSSGEMYGQPEDGLVGGFYEGFCGRVDYSDARSCYPSGKRASETLCQCYIKQYGMDAVIVRPCHCYGPTQTDTDSRALSQFIRKVLNGEDIVLKSDGTLERTHCYLVDAVQAIFLVLLHAKTGEAYNIADNASDASVREIAAIISETKGKQVIFDIPDATEKQGFSKVQKAVLNGKKLIELGWVPMWNLKSGIHSTIEIMEQENEAI